MAGTIVPGLTPSLTDPVQGQGEGEAPPDTQSFHGPEQATALQGTDATPQDALARVAADRDAPSPPPLPEVEGQDPLPDAIRTLARSGDGEAFPLDDPVIQTRLAQAARLPQGFQEDLALVVLAVAQARDLQADAVADLSPAQRQALSSGDLSPQEAREIRAAVDMDKSLQAARLVDAALRDARPALENWADLAAHPAVEARGLAAPAEAPTPQQQASSVLASLGTPGDPADMIRSGAALQGHDDLQVPPTPEALEEAPLDRLLVTAYVLMGIPNTPQAAASLAALDGLPEPARETAAEGLRHYVHALTLQRKAMEDLDHRERLAVREAAPHLAGGTPHEAVASGDLSPEVANVALEAAEKIDQRRVHQSAAVLAQASEAMEKDGGPIPETETADCPRNDRNPRTDGVSPVRTDRPVECTVGDLTVFLGLTEDSAVVLQVDTDGDGEPDFGPAPLGRSPAIRLHWDPARLQVTVYEDTNDDDRVQEDEIEFQTQPLRDRSNNVAFVDPFGFFVVGSQGPTIFDHRYGNVQVPPEPRDERVDTTRGTIEDNAPDPIPEIVDDDEDGVVVDATVESGGDCRENKPGEGPCRVDSRRVDDTAWRQLHQPANFTVNPNGTHALTVDLGGDSRYDRNIGAAIFQIYGPWDPEENVTAARLGTGLPGTLPTEVPPQLFSGGIPAAAIDLGGDDVYDSSYDKLFQDDNFTIGAGVFGSPGVVVDAGGDDEYRGQNFTGGVGLFGSVGLVADLGGDDSFHAQNVSLGTGVIGSGLFLAQGGNDTYRGGALTQGVADFIGAGLFADTGEGDDTFETTMDAGTFPIFQGGGDAGSKNVAQGASLGLGTGVMLDGGGNDTYLQPNFPDDWDHPRRIQGVSFKDLPRQSDPGGSNFINATMQITEAFFPGMPGVLADLGGDDEGLNRTSTIEHSYLTEVGLGPHFRPNDTALPTGYVVDAETPGGDDAATVTGDGYLLRPGDITWDARDEPVSEGNFTLTVPGLLAVGGPGPTNWTESYVVSLDLGGDDVYRNRPGAADVVPGRVPGVLGGEGDRVGGEGSVAGGEQYRPRLASLHVDLAGADTYTAEAVRDGPRQLSLGAGVGAVGLAYDLADDEAPADDTYEAATRAMGHGEAGVGVFHDEAGDDTYRLVDESNPSLGLGYGSLGGVGVLADAGGHDTYEAGELSLGAYEVRVGGTNPSAVSDNTVDDGSDAADSNDAEVGAGVFLDGSGGDTYDVPIEALGYVHHDHGDDGAARGLLAAENDTRPVAALFVDRGFGIDAYPEEHREAGHENNAFWNTTVLGQGIDNLDYYMHFQFVQAGDDTAQRAISLLLSPSARIVDPAYPANGTEPRETLSGTNVVTVNATYGGNRSLLLNARSLAVAPFHTGTPRVAGLEDVVPEPCDADDLAGNPLPQCPPQIPDITPPGQQTMAETGHHGVRYANVTYDALKFMISSRETRDGTNGPPDEHEDETERTLDIPQEVLGVENLVLDTNETLPPLMDFLVWDTLYNFLEGGAACTNTQPETCATDITEGIVVEFLLEGFVDPQMGPVWGCSDQAVSAYVGGEARYGECPVDYPSPSTPSTSLAAKRWTALQTLALEQALADSIGLGDPISPAVDTAMSNLGVPDATQKSSHDVGSDPVQDCAPLVETSTVPGADNPDDPVDDFMTCVIRASFHGVTEEADAARDGVDENCPSTPAADCGGLPEVINPPQGGEFVRAVELSADGKHIATVEGAANGYANTYHISWDVTEVGEDGRYLWEDGNHTLTAEAFYRPADPRPNRDTSPEVGATDTEDRTRDPYGFYPGVDRVQVRTDAPPKVYETAATDFDPRPDCDDGDLQCELEYTAVVSEDNLTLHAEAVPLDLGPDGDDSARAVPVDLAEGSPYNVTANWTDPEVSDGLWALNLTLEDPELGVSVTDATPFFVTRDAPSTLATPVANDAGFSGLQHVDVKTYPNNQTPDTSRESPWTLNVTALLDTDGDGTPDQVQPRSPVVDVTIFRRVYNPTTSEADELVSDESTCRGTWETAGSHGDLWCRNPVTNVTGNTSVMDVTIEGSDGREALDQRRYYLVAQATDSVGHVENVTFPDVSPNLGDDDPEGETFLDLEAPTSKITAETDPRNETRLTIPYEVSGAPQGGVTVYWDLAPNVSAAGDDPKVLPGRFVDMGGPGAFVWSPDVQEDLEVSDGDHLYLSVVARDAAGNVETGKEEGTVSSISPIRLDFSGPEVDGNVSVTRKADSLVFNWTSTDALDNSSARIRPAGQPVDDALLVNATGTAVQHRAVFEGLDQDTVYTVDLVMRDLAGNWNNVTAGNFSTDTVIDIEPLAPEDGGVVSGEATVAWRATRVNGDPSVHYNLTLAPDAGACTTPLETTRIFESEPVRREVTIDTRDLPSVQGAQVCLQANNTENPDNPVVQRIPANGTFGIDNEAPTTNLTVAGHNATEWIPERAEVVLEAQDATGEDLVTRYAVDDGSVQVYDGPFVLDEDGVHTVEFWSQDRLGHVEEHRTAEVRVDTTPPEGSLSIDDGASRTADRTVNLRVNGTDADSGIADISVASGDGLHRRLPGALLQGGEIQVPWEVSADDGRKRVRVVLADEAGNQLTLRRTITLDTRAPTIESLAERDAGFTQAAIDWSTDEPSAGEVLYKEEDSPAFEGSVDVNDSGVQHTVVLEGLTPGTSYVVKVVAEDPLGNAGERVTSFTTDRDTTPPGPIEGLQATVLPTGFVEVEWDEAFDQVGVASYVVGRSTADDDEFVKVAETPRPVLLDDEAPAGETLEYKVQAIDVAGNAGPQSEPVTVTTDTAPRILEAEVTPERGTADDTFTYRVVVQDRDGDTLEFVRAVVDGEPHPMSPSGNGSVTEGAVYTLERGLEATTLSQGTHTYGFHVSDGTQETRWPGDDPESGPVVLDTGESSEVAGFGAVRQAVPSPGPALILVAFAAAALLSTRRWTP